MPGEMDKLTGLLLEKSFNKRLEEEVLRARRYKVSISIIMFEVDFDYYEKEIDLKKIFSYTIYKQLSNLIKSTIRVIDIAGRYGGDHFVVYLPETDIAGGLKTAERIRVAVESHEFMGDEGHPRIKVTVSLGVASYAKHAATAKELLSAAIKGLQVVKAGGGNKVMECPITINNEVPPLPGPSTSSV